MKEYSTEATEAEFNSRIRWEVSKTYFSYANDRFLSWWHPGLRAAAVWILLN